MSPNVALGIWLVLLFALLQFDPARESRVSLSLWIPVIWFFIVGSRLPSQWMGSQFSFTADSFSDGNLLDRSIYLLLMLLALLVLQARRFSWAQFASANKILIGLLGFALISVLWSDFPLVSLKRWVRDFGAYLVILVILSDADKFASGRWVLRRLAYLLVPLSIVLIKYFPYMAREYDFWTGQAYNVGATTSKNMLGVLCLVSGLYFFSELLSRWRNDTPQNAWPARLLDLSFLAMTIWLLSEASSATSSICLVLGCIILTLSHNGIVRRNPSLLTVSIPIGIASYLLLQFGFGVDLISVVSEAAGRSPDLTGRTNIWSVVLSAGSNPIIGTGYESFWLGDRLQWVWERAGHINEAHNGYIEVYLQLGLIGVTLLIAFLVISYRTICRSFRQSPAAGSLGLGLWAVLVFYNFTEAAFRGHFIWIAFLLYAIVVPSVNESMSARSVAMAESRRTMHRSPRELASARSVGMPRSKPRGEQ